MLVLLIKGGMKGPKFGKQSFIIIEHSLIFVVALLSGNIICLSNLCQKLLVLTIEWAKKLSCMMT